MLNIGIIGFGYVGNIYYAAAGASKKTVCIRRIASPSLGDPKAYVRAHILDPFGGRPPRPTWSDLSRIGLSTIYHDVLADNEIKLIIIAASTRNHAEIVEAALQRKKHVLVESPLEMNPPQAVRLIELAKKQKVLLLVGQHTMFTIPVQYILHECLTKPKYGRLLSFRLRRTLGTRGSGLVPSSFEEMKQCLYVQDMSFLSSLIVAAKIPGPFGIASPGIWRPDEKRLRTFVILPKRGRQQFISREYNCGPSAAYEHHIEFVVEFERAAIEFRMARSNGRDDLAKPYMIVYQSGKKTREWPWSRWIDPYPKMFSEAVKLVAQNHGRKPNIPPGLCPESALRSQLLCSAEEMSVRQQKLIWIQRNRSGRFDIGESLPTPLLLPAPQKALPAPAKSD